MTPEQIALRCVRELNEMDFYEGDERKSVAILRAMRDAVELDRKERKHPPASPVSWARVEDIDEYLHDSPDWHPADAPRMMKDLLLYVKACQDRADALECELAMLANDREVESRLREAERAKTIKWLEVLAEDPAYSALASGAALRWIAMQLRRCDDNPAMPLPHEQTLETLRKYERALSAITKLGASSDPDRVLSNAMYRIAREALKPPQEG